MSGITGEEFTYIHDIIGGFRAKHKENPKIIILSGHVERLKTVINILGITAITSPELSAGEILIF